MRTNSRELFEVVPMMSPCLFPDGIARLGARTDRLRSCSISVTATTAAYQELRGAVYHGHSAGDSSQLVAEHDPSVLTNP